jgi:hypothetical protein
VTDQARTPSIFSVFPELPARESLDAAMQAVNVDDRLAFHKELLDGLYEASALGELGPLARAVRAWYRSALFMGREDFNSRIEQANTDLKGLTGQEP